MRSRSAQPAKAAVTARGRVDRLFCAMPEFCAGALEAEDGTSVHFAGRIALKEGDEVELAGDWEESKFGRQLKVASFQFALPFDAQGLANYLARNPHMKGIGPVRARAIADQFGKDFDQALQHRPEEIARVAKVPVEVIRTLAAEWLRTRAFNLANTWLAAFNLTHHQVTTLVKRYANNVIAIFKEDPYRIIREVEGYGFKRVDLIARRMGTPKDHPSRIRGGILHTMAEALDEGHCWSEYEDLVDQANVLLVMDTLDSRDLIRASLDRLIEEHVLVCEAADNRFLVAFPHIRKMERDLADIFRRGRERNPHFADVQDLAAHIASVAPELNAGQRRAVRAVLERLITVITGGAGSGKTYAVNSICRLFERRKLQVVLCAPTGKAAKRMEESTGRPASTIHRLLGYDGQEFRFDGVLDADLLVVDETSMCDVPLLWHLLRAVDLSRTAVILVGDHNQLPPVGPGNVLRDLIATQAVPVSMLTEVVRQAGILKENCNALLVGRVAATAPVEGDGLRPWYKLGEFVEMEDLLEFVRGLYEAKLYDELHLDLIGDVQLLTPTRKGPLGVPALNVELQHLIQKKLFGRDVPPVPPNRRPPLLPGDKVIMRKNTYSLDLMNGSVGQVVTVDPKSGDVAARFDGRLVTLKRSEGHLSDLDLAYALTIHQTQGSEFPVAIVIIHKAHSFQHHRNMLYTGATRAKRAAVIVGDHWGIRNCASKVQVNRRRTWLSMASTTGSPSSPAPSRVPSQNLNGFYGSGGSQ
jgi:exodeoxyribonuclease V alpha subunit